jgi:WD40 repeat protein
MGIRNKPWLVVGALLALASALVLSVIALGACLFLKNLSTSDIEPTKTLSGSDAEFVCVAFSPDSKLLAACQADGTVKVWSIPSGGDWLTIPSNPNVASPFGKVAFSPDGEVLAWANGARVSFLDINTKKTLEVHDNPDGIVRSLTFSRDSKTIVLGTNTGIVRLVDRQAKTSRVVLEEKAAGSITSTAIDPNNNSLAVGSFGQVVLINLKTGDVNRRSIDGSERIIDALAFTRDGEYLAGITGGRKVTLWNSATGKEVGVLAFTGQGTNVLSIAFSPNGRMLAMGVSGRRGKPSHLQLWDVATQREVANFVCHQDAVFQVAWSPDDNYIATCSEDRTARLWETATILKKQ